MHTSVPAVGATVQQAIVPCVIPAFNNPTYVRRMIEQLSRFPELRLFVADNASTFPSMLVLCAEIQAGQHGSTSLIRLDRNLGPRAMWYNLGNMPQYFSVTDPDIELNSDLPRDFVRRLIEVTDCYHVGKAGFAIDLADQHLMSQGRFRHAEGWMTIWEAEARHWERRLPFDPAIGQPLYVARIDTTFAIYNKKFFDARNPWGGIRVAGSYTCRHLPWYRDNGLPADEEAYYRRSTEFSYYLGDRPAVQLRELFAGQDAAAAVETPP